MTIKLTLPKFKRSLNWVKVRRSLLSAPFREVSPGQPPLLEKNERLTRRSGCSRSGYLRQVDRVALQKRVRVVADYLSDLVFLPILPLSLFVLPAVGFRRRSSPAAAESKSVTILSQFEMQNEMKRSKTYREWLKFAHPGRQGSAGGQGWRLPRRPRERERKRKGKRELRRRGLLRHFRSEREERQHELRTLRPLRLRSLFFRPLGSVSDAILCRHIPRVQKPHANCER